MVLPRPADPAESRDLHKGDTSQISDEEFHLLRQLIHAEAGISLSEAKRALLSSRLAKRLRHFGFQTYSQYYDHIRNHDPTGAERRQMINCITTNKTDFFREPGHFAFLKDKVFPLVRERAGRGGPRRLYLWSAGCSTGEEPYTLAMTLREYFGPPAGWDVKILASDIDTEVLQKADKGVYSEDRTQDLPEDLKRKYFLRGTGTNAGFVQVRPDLRRLITFQRINFIEEPWPLKTRFDIIFCRNVIIYFDRPTQQRLFQRMAGYLNSDGFLFMGHSENLSWLTDLFQPQGGTIYSLRPGLKSVRDPGSKPSEAGAGLPEKSIVVGEFFASGQPVVVQTVLGSCVAACLFDPEARCGGMNHFLLPVGEEEDETAGRYGSQAMDLLIQEIVKHGGNRSRLRAKVFGGAQMFHQSASVPDIGRKNACFVQEFLAASKIPIVSKRLGGTSALKVRFYPHEGRALVKPIDEELVNALNEGDGRPWTKRVTHPREDHPPLLPEEP